MLAINPVSMSPFEMQGVAKLDCVTVWFCSANWKMTTSPTAAAMVSGVYTLVVPPTTTYCVIMSDLMLWFLF